MKKEEADLNFDFLRTRGKEKKPRKSTNISFV